ncbi:Securin [Liparis tanakae]|uniref:Securin n=1 Tax=Liparis tanakae TaxID=230148 RepID=A0A4Z2HCR1_9TELE|nr:Securin [Liparis tanakae]
MDSIIFAERENTGLHPPNLKMRQRLQSVPEKLSSPMSAKTFHTPLPFAGRRAFGAVNKRIATPVVGTQETLKPQETKVKNASLIKVEEYPEIEKFIPYDPLDHCSELDAFLLTLDELTVELPSEESFTE